MLLGLWRWASNLKYYPATLSCVLPLAVSELEEKQHLQVALFAALLFLRYDSVVSIRSGCSGTVQCLGASMLQL